MKDLDYMAIADRAMKLIKKGAFLTVKAADALNTMTMSLARALAPGPEPLDAALLFAPVGDLVPAALRAVEPGGVVVCAGIHMSDIPAFPYRILWGERVVRSVANLTRRDGEEFLALAPRVPVRTEVQTFPLKEANEALARLRAGQVQGAVVLVID